MEVYGREYKFRLTVGAACDIADRCPDGKLQNFAQLLAGSGYVSATEGRSAFLCALSRGEEEARAFEEPGYEPKPLTPQLLRTLDMQTYSDLLGEATEAFAAGLQTTVGVAPSKKNGDAAGMTSR